MAENVAGAYDDGRAAATGVPLRDLDELLAVRTHFPHGFARTYGTRMLYAADAKGGGRRSGDDPQ